MLKTAKFFQALCCWPFLIFVNIFYNYEIKGKENLEEVKNRAVIFASNHAYSGLGISIDPMIAAYSMARFGFLYPKYFYPIRFMAFKEFFSRKNRYSFPFSWLVALYVNMNGSVPVASAGGNLEAALKDSIEALKNGDRLWIFPEGYMSMDGKIHEGKRGVAYLHKQTGTPIVPVGISGNFEMLLPKNLFSRKKVAVHYGKPVYSLGEKTLEEDVDLVMEKIKELVRE